MTRRVPPPVVRRLVDSQFPQWASLPLEPVTLDGWDNTTYRLGDDLSVRLPNADAYRAQVDKEHHWLPVLAPELPLAIPESIAVGVPSPEFPRPWSVRRWIEGEPCSTTSVNRGRLAEQLGRFLRVLQRVDGRDGPPAGPHSFFRGAPLRVYDDDARGCIDALAGRIDEDAVTRTWARALASEWGRPPVWVHGDVAPSNLLVRRGELAAVIDFGCCAVGDPACDLVVAWTFFEPPERAVFRSVIDLDERTWDRAKGWALWKALRVLREDAAGETSGIDAVRRFGWRVGAESLLVELTDMGREI